MDLAASETNSHFNFLAFIQPAPGIPHLETTVVIGRFWPEPDLFDLDLGLRFACFAIFLGFFVEEFSVIQYPTNRWIGVRSDLYEVQVGCLGRLDGFIDGYDALVFTVRVDEANLSGANLLIYPEF